MVRVRCAFGYFTQVILKVKRGFKKITREYVQPESTATCLRRPPLGALAGDQRSHNGHACGHPRCGAARGPSGGARETRPLRNHPMPPSPPRSRSPNPNGAFRLALVTSHRSALITILAKRCRRTTNSKSLSSRSGPPRTRTPRIPRSGRTGGRMTRTTRNSLRSCVRSSMRLTQQRMP